ncbi:MAG: hypothetical protein KJ941_02105 [Bacteroidetes bacterium]|nr:hypothetical protein [Bacteroidota bacterium]
MKTYLIFLFSVLSFMSFSQRNYALFNMQSLPQNHYYNPAMGSPYKLSVSLPLGMQSFGFSNSSFSLNDILVKRADDSLVIDPSAAYGKLKSLNFLEFGVQSELFGLGLKIKDQYFSFSAMARGNATFIYPKDFYLLLLEGNGNSLLGRRADMDGLGLNLNAYMEYAFGYNRKLSEKLTAGARVKFLSGVMNVATRKSRLGLTTNEEDYSLTLDGELDVRTSGIIPLMNDSIEGQNPVSQIYSFQNNGLAFDLGVTYKLSEKLSLNTSITDLGYINWNADVYNYKKDALSYTFDGVDLNEAIRDSNYVENLTDTLAEIFKLEKDNESYRQSIPLRITIGGQYKIIEKLTVYSTLFNDFQLNKYRPTIVLGGAFSIRDWFKVGANYMATTNSFGNVGVSLFLRGSGIQYFISTDNVLGALNFAAHKNFHVSTGLSLTFGKPKKEAE